MAQNLGLRCVFDIGSQHLGCWGQSTSGIQNKEVYATLYLQAVSGVFGAGLFVTTVVVGAISLTVPFTVDWRPFTRDVLCFLAAALFVYGVLFAGQIVLGEAIALLALYALYVVVVVVGLGLGPGRRGNPVCTVPTAPTRTKEDLADDPLLGAEGSTAIPNGGKKGICDAGSVAAAGDLDPNQLLAGRASVNFLTMPRRVQPLKQLGAALVSVNWLTFRKLPWYWQLVAVIRAPIHVVLTLTIPVVDMTAPDKNWKRLLAAVQVFIAPAFVVWGFEMDQLDLGSGAIEDTAVAVGGGVFPVWAVALAVGAIAAMALLLATSNDTPPRRYHFFSFLSFLVSVTWITLIADEIVAILEAIGLVLNVSHAILGLLVLGPGNSVGDFVANLAVAKQGKPQMAIAAAFGGPTLNTLIGIGLAGTVACARQAGGAPYPVDQTTLHTVSGAFLIGGLVLSLAVLSLSGFRSSRPHGFSLLSLYAVSLGVCIAFEVVGTA